MPDKPNTIYLCEGEEMPEVTGPQCLKGRVAVLMYSGEKRGSILAPPSGILNPDVGVIVNSGIPLQEGTEVVCRPYHGKWIDDWQRSGRQLRLFGVSCPWYDSIPAIRTPIGLEPTHDWVLLKGLRPQTDLILPDLERETWQYGEIVAFGPLASDLTVGNRCVFEAADVLDFAFGEKDSLLVRYKRLLCEF